MNFYISKYKYFLNIISVHSFVKGYHEEMKRVQKLPTILFGHTMIINNQQ